LAIGNVNVWDLSILFTRFECTNEDGTIVNEGPEVVVIVLKSKT